MQDKLRRGLFIELRPHSAPDILKGLIEAGQTDWSSFALCTDDRSCSDTLKLGATDHNVRVAIAAGVAPETAIQMVTINPARHMRLTPWVGSIAPGRFADVVLLDDVPSLSIAEVWADGEKVSAAGQFLKPHSRDQLADWATRTVKIDRDLMAQGFRDCRRSGPGNHASRHPATLPLGG